MRKQILLCVLAVTSFVVLTSFVIRTQTTLTNNTFQLTNKTSQTLMSWGFQSGTYSEFDCCLASQGEVFPPGTGDGSSVTFDFSFQKPHAAGQVAIDEVGVGTTWVSYAGHTGTGLCSHVATRSSIGANTHIQVNVY
ncbi:MAG: hypothetical protein EOO01_08970 [Chitinophagaceae bacterium]|nr:MAG: hypothetical protein EOO01_08970 [Chitinophagaceae bacterium]